MNIEDELRQSMAIQAEGLVDVAPLLTGATSRGVTLRRRRRAAVTLVVVAVLGVGVGGPVAVWATSAGTGQGIDQAGTDGQGPAAVPMPPSVPGRPTVQDDPSVLGSDPTLLHLSVEGPPPGLPTIQTESPTGNPSLPAGWASMLGSEYLRLGSPVAVDFWAGAMALEQTRGYTRQGEVTVNDKPAQYHVHAVQQLILWQPVTGVWVAARGINGTSKEALIAAASSLRFDRVSSCAVRFATAAAPPTAVLSRCDTNMTAEGLATGGRLVYSRADGSLLDIRDRGADPAGEVPNATVAGHPAHWRTGDVQGVKGDILTVDIPGGRNVFVLLTGSFTRAEAEAFVAGLTWP
ncbi:hypothetical protein [Plantactinospora soyae]|uniref:Uncharacterized protein n=1 Tax=Plantactinospora soyae TaxID=1544732 RepID=A0A927RAF9_9ACTN|nr:hypothetical protein [Plantactinospora soyae]MBE1490711.1 hypothetical protein [Plantactinospora soyae]